MVSDRNGDAYADFGIRAGPERRGLELNRPSSGILCDSECGQGRPAECEVVSSRGRRPC